MSWGRRTPQKPLTLIIIKSSRNYGLDANEENVIMIEKYKRLGIIKEFKTEKYDIGNYLYSFA